MGENTTKPRIAVFGLGYVGAVSAACFADRGHEVVGVDISQDKVDLINSGKTTVVEDRIGELVTEVVASGKLRATTSVEEAVLATDLCLICVGTPSAPSGGLGHHYLERVAEQIGEALPKRDATLGRYTVVVRSTMIPGTCESVVIPRLEANSGLTAGVDFGVAVNPEFLRESTSVKDFYDPPKTVIGALDPDTADAVATLYEGLPGPVYRTPIKVAEMTKYVDNSFHALKVAFANEVGTICRAFDLDSHQVMDIFKSDTKLNVAPTYLTPGYAFGGSCLPKDVRALLHAARHNDVTLPVWESIIPSNDSIIDRIFGEIERSGARNIGMFGLSFKSGTDDLRESPMVTLAERLLGRGFDVKICDEQVRSSHIQGANREYVDARIPHLSAVMASPTDVASHADLIILGTKAPEAIEAIADAGETPVIDLVRPDGVEKIADWPQYQGIAW